MSQNFDVTKPATGVTTFGVLYSYLRDNFSALDSCHSGTSAPSSGNVAGRFFYNTSTGLLYVYTGAAWKEVAVEDVGFGAEIELARGSLASLDQRFDVSHNEDGTLKASTSLNPSQWYTITQASGYVSTTSFKAFGANYTTTYLPTRRLKINRGAGTYFTEVYSSSYSAPDTTVVTRDAVISTDLVSVEHSIVSPRKASGGDGAVSYEMISNKNVVTYSSGSNYQTLVGDSVILMTAGGTAKLIDPSYYPNRVLIIVNTSASTACYVDPQGWNINGSSSTLTIYPKRTISIISNGSNWSRIDQPATEGWTDVSSFGSGWVGVNVAYMKDPMGFVHLKGNATVGDTANAVVFTLGAGYRPEQASIYPAANYDNSGSKYYPIIIGTDGTVTVTYYSLADYVMLDGITFKAA